jgi:energy-coupling factor transport system permease protein
MGLKRPHRRRFRPITGRSALSYVGRRGPLQAASPGAAVAYLGSLVAVAFLFPSPLVMLAAAGAVTIAGLLAGARAAMRASLRMSIGLVTLIALVNALIVDRGETVLLRLGEWPWFGNVNVTLEALVAGLGLGLQAAVTILAAGVYVACVDPDRVLRALRPVAARSALSATLVSRLVPLAAADAAGLRDAARLRGPGAAEVGRAALVRRLLAGSLDRSVDVAATLELRGYGLDAPRARQARRRSRYDRRFHLVAAAVVAIAVAGRILGLGEFQTYPSVEAELDLGTVALAVAVLLSGLAPLRRRQRRAAGRGRTARPAAPGQIGAARV